MTTPAGGAIGRFAPLAFWTGSVALHWLRDIYPEAEQC
jgi:hypothetical protein